MYTYMYTHVYCGHYNECIRFLFNFINSSIKNSVKFR